MTFPATNNHCATVHPPTSLSYFTASLSVLLAIITIPGNFLVFLAIIKDPFRNLKTPFNYFMLSLAATDLAVGAILDPISVAYHIDEALQLNVVDITVLHIFYFILSTASILTLAALAMDRYFAVASPVKYKTMVTSKRAILVSVSIWIGALGFSFIYFKLGFIVYSFVFANTAVFTTFLVLIFVHVGILKRLRERSKYWRDQRAMNYAEPEQQENRNDIINTKKEGKAAKALMIILLAFFSSLTPACVMIYLLNFCSKCSCLVVHWLRDLKILIVLCNSGINPYLYAWRLPQFNKAFYKFLHLRSRDQRNNVPTTSTLSVGKTENPRP
ncbi:adenosine receptor A1-like [Orbicella faveolata]|uniref:adenosine receptor A1-like n=1 Tax=Orbicella faveolata TaxID=48498 RepID=UPI0009E5CFD9|nr:adenosine receptor A1-like [Orbicella faveolata]